MAAVVLGVAVVGAVVEALAVVAIDPLVQTLSFGPSIP